MAQRRLNNINAWKHQRKCVAQMLCRRRLCTPMRCGWSMHTDYRGVQSYWLLCVFCSETCFISRIYLRGTCLYYYSPLLIQHSLCEISSIYCSSWNIEYYNVLIVLISSWLVVWSVSPLNCRNIDFVYLSECIACLQHSSSDQILVL